MNTSPDRDLTSPQQRIAKIADRSGANSVLGPFISGAAPELIAASEQVRTPAGREAR
jgi:hypothetical protein